MTRLNVELIVIDGQKDFMDDADSALPVPGANEDMRRVAALIDRIGPRLADIHATLDSHRVIDVGHPGMWRNERSEMPPPFTMISADDIENGIWTPRSPSYRANLLAYARELERVGFYKIMVWPEHCLIGSPGHNLQTDLADALKRWERRELANVNFKVKGTNAFREHYGALMAEVNDPNDPGTLLDTDFLDMLSKADMIAVAGEALSHCVKRTVEQIVENIGAEHLKKFYILTDCTSSIPKIGDGPDFPEISANFLKDMEARGLNLTTSMEFLA